MSGPGQELSDEQQRLRDALRELRDQALRGRSLTQQDVVERANERLRSRGYGEITQQRLSDWCNGVHVPQDLPQLWAPVQVMLELTETLPPPVPTPRWEHLPKHPAVLSEFRRWKKLWEGARRAAQHQKRARRRGAADQACPYPGLSQFTENEAQWFFGRKALTSHIKQRLERCLADRSPLVIVAPSGAGKSSLLRAGVLPELEAGKLPGSERWPQVVLTPTVDPPAALAAKLMRAEEAQVAAALAAGPADLTRLVRQSQNLPPGGRVVLVVDQLEELFTLCQDQTKRERFVAALADLTQEGVALPLYGLRADFYGSCADFPHLRNALANHQVIVGPMTDDEVKDAVVLPAERSGLSLETGLVKTILRDLRGTAGQDRRTYRAELLPRLAHALRATWLERGNDNNTLTVAGYHDSGGIDGAIASTAEEEFDSLTEPERDAARLLFLRLVMIGEHGEVARHRRARDDLVRDAADPQAARDVIDRFVGARLLTQGAERDNGPVTVEVTHEALLWAWPQLRAWIEQDLEALLVRQQLDAAVQDWDRQARDPAYLYRGLRLDNADQAVRDRSQLGPLTQQFLDASTQLRSDEQAAAAAEQEAVRRRSRNRAVLSGVLAVLLVIATTTAAVAVAQGRTLSERNSTISQQLQEAEGTRVAGLAITVRDTDPATAKQLAVAAASLAPGSYESRNALLTLYSQPELYTYRPQGVDETWKVSADGTGHLMAYSRGHDVKVADIDARKVTRSITVPGWPVQGGLSISADGRALALGRGDGTIGIWDTATGRPWPTTFRANTKWPYPQLSPRATRVLYASAEDTTVWDTTSGRSVLRLPYRVEAEEGAITPDDKQLIVARGTDLQVWDLDTGKKTRTLRPATGPGGESTKAGGPLSNVAVSPDGRLVAFSQSKRGLPYRLGVAALTSSDTPEVVWSVTVDPVMRDAAGSRVPVFSLDGDNVAFEGKIWEIGNEFLLSRAIWDFSGFACSPWTLESIDGGELRFGADGRTLRCAGGDGISTVVSLDSIRDPVGIAEYSGNPTLSEDGSTLAVKVLSGWEIWDPGKRVRRGKLPKVPETYLDATLSRDGRTLALSASADEIQIWDTTSLSLKTTVTTGHDLIADFRLSPDGRTLAVLAGGSGPVSVLDLWDTATGTKRVSSSGEDRSSGASGAGHGSRIVFSHDGRSVVSASDQGLVDTTTGKRLVPPESGITAPRAVSRDGLLAVPHTNKMSFWDVKTLQREFDALLGVRVNFSATTFSPDGQMFAFSDDDRGQIRLWDIMKRQSLGLPLTGYYAPLNENISKIGTLAFSPDGSTLLAVDYWGHIRHHLIDPARIKAAFCSQFGALSREAWKIQIPVVHYRNTC